MLPPTICQWSAHIFAKDCRLRVTTLDRPVFPHKGNGKLRQPEAAHAGSGNGRRLPAGRRSFAYKP
uniref:Uncharacterized protein n=1 Tax=Ralstonia syzygii R24 TaxID=907261 RepID=G3ABH3_9RALS|nr:hypothetical protein RALSY_mp30183 [Ralstonia syzygii R24]